MGADSFQFKVDPSYKDGKNCLIGLPSLIVYQFFLTLLNKGKNDLLQGSYMSGKWEGIFFFFFFKVRELSGNSVMSQEKMKFCKNVRKMSRNVAFQPDETSFWLQYCQGKLEFTSGKCQKNVREVWSVLNV